MGTEIERYKDTDALRYIIAPSSDYTPARIEHPDDMFGLYEHDKPREAKATAIFNSFNQVCLDIICADESLRQQLLDNKEMILISTLQMDDYRTFEIYRYAMGDSVQYTARRADDGIESGGFTIKKNQEGSIILNRKNGQKPVDPRDDDYLDALSTVSRFFEQVAKIHNVPITKGPNQIGMSEKDFFDKVKAVDKEQNSFKNKTIRALQPIMRKLVNIVTVEQNLKRKPRYSVLIPLALTMPLPYYSDSWSDSIPLARPASVELLADTFGLITREDPPTEAEAAQAAYLASNTDLPDEAYAISTSGSPIPAVPSVSVDIAANAPGKTHIMTINSPEDIIDVSVPVRITLEGQLSPEQCTAIEFDPALEGTELGAVSVSGEATSSLEISSSNEQLVICNTDSERSMFANNTVIYVDKKN